jgi:hypothetical protein
VSTRKIGQTSVPRPRFANDLRPLEQIEEHALTALDDLVMVASESTEREGPDGEAWTTFYATIRNLNHLFPRPTIALLVALKRTGRPHYIGSPESEKHIHAGGPAHDPITNWYAVAVRNRATDMKLWTPRWVVTACRVFFANAGLREMGLLQYLRGLGPPCDQKFDHGRGLWTRRAVDADGGDEQDQGTEGGGARCAM